MNKYDRAMQNTASTFSSPLMVLNDTELSKEQKIEILRCWEFDARELEVAEEENMGGSQPDVLSEILTAIRNLETHNR